LSLQNFSQIYYASIGVDSGGSPGTRPPIIEMGAKPLFAPIIREEFLNLLRKTKNRK